jgi:23S rRNA maturation-related 3'-5' exoribonuclease YhaM
MRALHNEENEWRLKSRAVWLQTGDKNTSFFHKKEKSRQNRNTVEEIKTAPGTRINYFEEIKKTMLRKRYEIILSIFRLFLAKEK